MDLSAIPGQTGPVFTTLSAAILTAGGVGLAASALVDFTKFFWGGVSNAGFRHIEHALDPFRSALGSIEADWMRVTRALWINGATKADQKANAKRLIRMGMIPTDPRALADPTVFETVYGAQLKHLARVGHVDEAGLRGLLLAQATGVDLTPAQSRLSDRFDAAAEAAIDAGFEQADQQYRNAAKVLAGLLAVGLAIALSLVLKPAGMSLYAYATSYLPLAILFGLTAVPLAPAAKDAASALQAAASALKTRP